jgi:hypothetical protein
MKYLHLFVMSAALLCVAGIFAGETKTPTMPKKGEKKEHVMKHRHDGYRQEGCCGRCLSCCRGCWNRCNSCYR